MRFCCVIILPESRILPELVTARGVTSLEIVALHAARARVSRPWTVQTKISVKGGDIEAKAASRTAKALMSRPQVSVFRAWHHECVAEVVPLQDRLQNAGGRQGPAKDRPTLRIGERHASGPRHEGIGNRQSDFAHCLLYSW